jgi:UDP-N-acetylmuramyl tripeptide synthase
MSSPSTIDTPHRRAGLPLVISMPIARLARALSRLLGREGGALPGRVLLALSPRALEVLSRRGRKRGRRIVLVSATNGKTTTTALLAEMLAAAGLDVVHNVTGANLRSGIATTLLQAGHRGDVCVLETDEATLPRVAPDLQPDLVVLGNLFRDQLDRFGELEVLADRWHDTLAALDPATVTVVYNADDPLIASLVETQSALRGYATVAFGFDDPSVAQEAVPHAADSRFCRVCGNALDYAHSWVGHLGSWSCSSCGATPAPLDVRVDHVHLDGLATTTIDVELRSGEQSTMRLPIPGLYNVYNAITAIAAADVLGVELPVMATAIATAGPAFGRFERIPVPGPNGEQGTITLLLVKNPTGLNEVVRTLVTSGVDLTATLFALNDEIADGRDTSWVWDADVEPLLERAGAMVVTGERAAEFGLRAIYGGLDPAGVLYEPDLEQAMYRVLERAREFTEHGHAYALLTYTAMLRMRAMIAAQGWTKAYWANQPRKRRR